MQRRRHFATLESPFRDPSRPSRAQASRVAVLIAQLVASGREVAWRSMHLRHLNRHFICRFLPGGDESVSRDDRSVCFAPKRRPSVYGSSAITASPERCRHLGARADFGGYPRAWSDRAVTATPSILHRPTGPPADKRRYHSDTDAPADVHRQERPIARQGFPPLRHGQNVHA